MFMGGPSTPQKNPRPPNLELQLLTKATDHSPDGSCSTSEEAEEQLRVAIAEKAYAEEARREAKRQIEAAEREFANAKRIRQQALAELEKAQLAKEQAAKQVDSAVLGITCHSCRHKFQSFDSSSSSSSSLSYISAALREWHYKKIDL